jgi:hypothetical protein
LSSVDAFVATLAGFEPRVHTPDECVRIVESLARLENASAAARSRAAAHAAKSGAHRRQGFNNPADWVAKTKGSTTAEAERELRTGDQLEGVPETREKVNHGELSMEQANEIAETEKACPGSEQEMLDAAKKASLRELREKGRKKRLEAVNPEDLERRQRAARYHRHWKDEMGMIRYSGSMVPSEGVPFMRRLDVETDRAFRRAHRDGRAEPRECYAADAFASMMKGGGKPHAVRADVVFVCDVTTGTSRIVGGGPVPMSTVRQAVGDAFIKAVLHDGIKVDTVVHYGRKKMPGVLRTVLELGDPPEFDGVTCVDCGRQFHLEWDHDDPVANDGPTCRDNLRPRCWCCHQEKTERDRLAGLLEGKRARAQPP